MSLIIETILTGGVNKTNKRVAAHLNISEVVTIDDKFSFSTLVRGVQ